VAARARWPLPLVALIVEVLGAATLLAVWRPESALWLTVGALVFGNRTEIPALYFWGRYLPTVGVAIFVLAVLVNGVRTGRTRWQGKALLAGYACFGVVFLVSSLYNEAALRDVCLSLLLNLRYPLWLVALLNADLTPAVYRRLILAFVLLVLLQVPVSIAQFALGLAGDSLGGTLGGNESLIAVTLVGQCALLASWLATSRHGVACLLGAVALMIPGSWGTCRWGWFSSRWWPPSWCAATTGCIG